VVRIRTSTDAICKWFRISLNDGRSLGLSFQHISIISLNPSGHVLGIGGFSLPHPTMYMMALCSMPSYGTSHVSNSQRTTPKDQMSTFSEHSTSLMASGAIQATVPAKLIFSLTPFQVLDVPKSLIFITSSSPIKTLQQILLLGASKQNPLYLLGTLQVSVNYFLRVQIVHPARYLLRPRHYPVRCDDFFLIF
jgi:hypothetical protein